MDRRSLLLPFVFIVPAGFAAPSQDVFKCTGPEGRVTYQQARCASSDDERQVDVSPANPAYDLSGRERVLKQEEALDRRLEARAAADRARRLEQEERDARERLVKAQEQRARAAEQPVYVLPRFWSRPPMASHSLSPSRRQPNDTRP